MRKAKLFMNGRSQAVRLPKEFRFEGDEVLINKVGSVVMLIPKDAGWSLMEEAIGSFSDDFMVERNQPTKPDRRRKL